MICPSKARPIEKTAAVKPPPPIRSARDAARPKSPNSGRSTKAREERLLGHRPGLSRGPAVILPQTGFSGGAERNASGGEKCSTLPSVRCRLGVFVRTRRYGLAHDTDDGERGEPGGRGEHDATRRHRSPGPPPDHRAHRGEDRQQVQQLDRERNPDQDLPGGDEPAGDDGRGPCAAISAQEQHQTQWDARTRARGDARLVPAPGRVNKRHARDRRGRAAQAELRALDMRPRRTGRTQTETRRCSARWQHGSQIRAAPPRRSR